MKGTTFNPMIVKDVSAASKTGVGGGGLSGGIFGKGGIKQAGNLFKKGLKSNALTSLAMGGIDAATNLSEGKGAGESIGRALISGITSFGGGALGSLIAPGAGTIGGGILGGIAGDKIGDLFFGEQTPQQVEDGIAPSDKGPFTVTDKFGATSITTKGDSLAVSPNINVANQPINPTINANPTPNPNIDLKPIINPNITPSLDLTPLVNAFNNFKNDVINVMNRPQPTPQFALNVDGRQIGTAIGKQMETGTSQNISTGYTIA
jgi:hypothetical protein